MKQFISTETLQYFLNVLKSAKNDQMIRITSRVGNPFKGGECYQNLGVSAASITHRKYTTSNDQREGFHHLDREYVKGLCVTGPDFDKEGKKETIFVPYPTGVTIYYPELPTVDCEESSLGAALAEIGNAMAPIFTEAFSEKQKENDSHKFRIPIEDMYDDAKYTPEEAYSSLKSAVSASGKINEDTVIITMNCNGGNKSSDMVITDVHLTPDGVIIAFKDLTEYQGVTYQEILLRTLNGEIDLPLPNATHHLLIKNIEGVQRSTPHDHAVWRLHDHEKEHNLWSPMTIQPKHEQKRSNEHLANILKLIRVKSENHGVIGPNDNVVSIRYDRGQGYGDMIILDVEDTSKGTIIVFKDLDGYYKEASHEELLLRLICGQEGLSIPQKTERLLVYSLDSVEILPAKEYAAKQLNDDVDFTSVPLQKQPYY